MEAFNCFKAFILKFNCLVPSNQTKTPRCSAVKNTNASSLQQRDFSPSLLLLADKETHFKTRYKWKESTKQLFNLCSTWQQQPLETVYQGTFLGSVPVSSFFSFSSAHQAALATIRAAEAWRGETYSGGVEGNYKRNQFNEFPPCMKKCL